MPLNNYDPSSSRTFHSSEFDLSPGPYHIGGYTFGPYNLGSFKSYVGTDGISFSYKKRTPDVSVIPINRKLSEVGDDFMSPPLMRSLQNTLQKIKVDLSQVVVEELAFEGPGAQLGVDLKKTKFGAKATAQFGSVRLKLVTPTDQLIVRFKRGLGVGLVVDGPKNLEDKKQKTRGAGIGLWEFEHKTLKTDSPLANSTQNAKQFVVKQKVASPEPSKTEEKRLLDATIEEITRSLPIDAPHGEKLRRQYHSAPDATQGFIDFQKELQKSPGISGEEIIYASARASLFLSEVANLTKNRELARFSTGLKAVTQGFAGLHEIHSACGLIQSAKTLSLANASDLLGGAGMVLAGISLLSSLLDDDEEEEEENGLGEALSEIHSSIMNMWGEMRESFQITWQKIDGIHTHLDEIEGNNWKRFNQTMSLLTKTRGDILVAMAVSHTDVIQGQKALQFQILDIKQKLFPYLDLLIDMPVKRVILELFKSEMPDIEKKAMEYGNELRLWLTENARIRAGFNLDASQATLDQLIPLNGEPSDIPLGLFFTLTRLFVPSLFSSKGMPLVNPNHWDKILEVYLTVINIALPDILNKPDEIQAVYLEELDLLKSIVDNTIEFFEVLAHSETLFFVLIDQYQKSFLPLFQLLPKLIEERNSVNDKKILIQTQIASLIAPMQRSYNHLMGFFHLLDLNYIPLREPLVITDIQNILRALDASSDEPIDHLLKLLIARPHPELWKEPFDGYLKKGFSLETLKVHLKESLLSHPVLLSMRQAQENMDSLIERVHTEIVEHHATMNELLESADDLDKTLEGLSVILDKLQPFLKSEEKAGIQTQLGALKNTPVPFGKASFFAQSSISQYRARERINQRILDDVSP